MIGAIAEQQLWFGRDQDEREGKACDHPAHANRTACERIIPL